jgi:hypothetical protein
MLKRRDTLLYMIADSYKRMATNDSPIYRREQLAKCNEWLAELTEMFKSSPELLITQFPQPVPPSNGNPIF